MLTNFKYILSLILVIVTNAVAGGAPSHPDFNKQLADAGSDSQKVLIYRSIYDYYNSISNDSSRPWIEQGLTEFTEKRYEAGRGFMLLLLSNIYNERGMLVVAREKAQVALSIFAKLKNGQGTGRAHNAIGNSYSYQNNYTEAIRHFLAALKDFEHINDTANLVNTYLELGAANDFNSNHEKALAYYNKALNLSLQATETASIVYLYNNIGLSYARNGEFDTALKYFEKAELISRKPEYIKARIPPLTNMGKIYDAKGDDKKALQYMQQALSITKTFKTREPQCRVLLEIGRIEAKHTPPVISSLEEGLQIAREIGIKRLQAEFLNALAEVADKKGDYKEEVRLLKQTRILVDSIFTVDKAKEIANLQSEYELKRTNTQLAALERSEIRNKQKKNAIIIIAVFLAVTLLTLFIFYTRSRKLNRKLSAREKDLKKANDVKDRLFSIIGHDLKGPVGNIPSLLSIYKSDATPDADKAYILRKMEESSQASLEILEKLLSWGKQQIKGNIFSPVEMDVNETLDNNLRLLTLTAENKNITLINSIPNGMHVFADEDQFKFIVRNLLANAIKYTHPGGIIEITATRLTGEDMVCFAVKDTGVGIDAAKQRHIFEPYNKSTVGTANESGTSIGLTLSREFVIQNGGRIWVESAKGQGAAFYFTIKSNSADS